MASVASVTSLADEVNCPICQGSLREPVTIDCGHNFCLGCLTRYCEIPGPDPEEPPICPLCKEPFRTGSFRPNWQLASVVENIERLKLVSRPDSEEEDTCHEHREKIYFFCEDDEMQLCVVCREAWEHRAHTVRFLEDAAVPYRVGEGKLGLSQDESGLRIRAELWIIWATMKSDSISLLLSSPRQYTQLWKIMCLNFKHVPCVLLMAIT